MSSPLCVRLLRQTGDKSRRLMRSRRVERLFDVVIAGGLLVSTLPVLAVVAIAVRLDSSGPVFHRAIRTGQHGCLFTLYKFRTMSDGLFGMRARRPNSMAL